MAENNSAEQIGGAFMAIHLTLSSLAIALHEGAPHISERVAKLLQEHADRLRREASFAPAVRQLDSWQRQFLGRSSITHH